MKRSSQVALLLMGTMSVGAGAYALMPSENCPPAQGGVAQPGSQPAECRGRTSSSGYSYYGGSGSRASSSSGYLGQNLASGNSSATNTSTAPRRASNTSTSRAGFGSFASHFTGGG